MVDRYTRFILTVIALVLVVLAVRPLFESRQVAAQAQGGEGGRPSLVQIVGGPVPVAITGQPILVHQ